MKNFILETFKYEIDPVLDNLINKGLNAGIDYVYSDEYSINMTIVFKDNSELTAEIGDRYST